MAKYSEKLVDKIVELIEEDNYTITDICKILGVGRITFYKWKSSKPEFAKVLNEAAEHREEKMRLQARKSIRKKLEGYRQVETKTTYIADKNSDNPNELIVKEYVVKEKYCMPETSAITFALSEQTSGSKTKRQPFATGSALNVIVNNEDTKRHLEMLGQRLNNFPTNLDTTKRTG